MEIPFNKPIIIDAANNYINEVIRSGRLSGGHEFNKKCNKWIEKQTKSIKAFLTTSCTHSLEMASFLFNIQKGDEVIMPSYTFTSTANAFVLRGAKIVFVDIRPDTMNINENLIEDAITKKTKAIVPVHIAGVACEMDTISSIAEDHNLYIVEDAAQGLMAKYKGQSLGTIGHLGTISFHETKNYTCGEGGAILINEAEFIEPSEILMEKGTNRQKFFRGEIDKYSWQDIGSSYVLSELNASYLYAQLEIAENINKNRLNSWDNYFECLNDLQKACKLELPTIPSECSHNAHMFYIKVKNLEERTMLISHLKKNKIDALFHYIPLHSSKAGLKYGRFHGVDGYTTKESERLLRLPLFFNISTNNIEIVCDTIKSFYSK